MDSTANLQCRYGSRKRNNNNEHNTEGPNYWKLTRARDGAERLAFIISQPLQLCEEGVLSLFYRWRNGHTESLSACLTQYS